MRIEFSCDLIFNRIINETCLPELISLNQFEDGFFSYFSQNRQELYDDTEPTLLRLLELGYKIGYLTDVPYGQKRPSDRRSRDITKKLLKFSSLYLSSVDIGFRKPEAIGFKELAKAMHCNCKEILFVGNEEKDIKGSKKAGMIACLISRGKEQFHWGQDLTIYSIHDLIDFLGS